MKFISLIVLILSVSTAKTAEVKISYEGEYPFYGQVFRFSCAQKAGETLTFQKSLDFGTTWQDFYVSNAGGEDQLTEIYWGTKGWGDCGWIRAKITNP